MKYRVVPTGRERVMRDDDFIVSKTDLKGRITYGNRVFIEFSGYTEPELLGAPHNIIRHPDMPRGVFKFLWDTLQSGKECFAYVKNLSKDGGFYWVFATVTPSYDSNRNIIGYYSVRRAPRRDAIQTVEGLYRAMVAEEATVPTAKQPEASLQLLTRLLAEKRTSYEDFVLSI